MSARTHAGVHVRQWLALISTPPSPHPSNSFLTFAQLTAFVERLLAKGCALIVVRAKDRFNKPLDSGYRDMLLNVRLEGSDHVGELQLHLRTIIDIKEAAHRTYALMRRVGWQDDSLEDEDKEDDEEEAEVEVDQAAGGGVSAAAGSFERPRTWTDTWAVWGGDQERGPAVALEMTAATVGTIGVDQENPIIAEASKDEGGTGARGKKSNESLAAAALADLDLGDHTDVL